MSRITKEENKALAGMMLSEPHYDRHQRERVHRDLPEDQQPPMVVFFGMLDYKIIWVAPEGGEKGRQLAETELEWWKAKARRVGLAVPGFTREADEHDFQVRTQASLDHLTAAIRSGYESAHG